MNVARLAIGGIIVSAIAAGIALYYLQVYAYYDEITLQVEDVQMTSLFTGEPEPIMFENVKAIDSDSSPVRFRACFDTPLSFGLLTESYEIYDAAEPLNAPGWFDCFQSGEIGADLASGVAVAFLGVENIQYGIDRIIAVYPDGRAYAWHQINACGEVVFDGNPSPENCPPAPERLQ